MTSRAVLIFVLLLAGCATNSIPTRPAALPEVGVAERQVADTERAFARTMSANDNTMF